jgi:gliding motility-associated-like protein
LQYGTNAVAARNNLVSSKSWTITGDSPSAIACSASSPSITVNASLSPFSQVVGAPSIAQNFVVSGVNLVNNIVVNAPVNYQVSLVSGSGYTNSVVINQNAGTVNNTNVFIRLNASVAGIHNGTVNINSLGASSKTVVVNGQTYVGSSNTCSTAYELCFGTSTVVSYPAATSGTGQTGPAYGCVTSQPNPTWLYFKTNSVITNSTTSFVFSSSTNQDIDFILWGPISNFTNLCSAISNSTTINGCSYSTAATETVTISNTQPNQYYVLLITNFASTAHFINITCTQGVNNICPIISSDFSFPSSVCVGQAVAFNDLSTSNDGIDSWTYTSSASTPSVSSLQNPSFIFSSSGTYSVILTVTSGTVSSSLTKTISVNSNPIIQSVVSNTNTCLMSAVTFSNSGASTYTLLPNNFSGSEITYTTTIAGLNTYTIQGTNVNGCIGNKIISILTNSLPIISSVLSDNSVCLGEQITFTNNGASTYTILPSNNTGAFITEVPDILGSITYTIIGADNIGCVGEITKSFEVFDLPTIIITPSVANVCQGEGIQITLNGAVSYTDAIGATTQTLFTLYFGGSETYTISGEDANGCINSASASITVLNKPTVSISSPTSSICYGYTQTITAVGADSYIWFNGATTNTAVIQPLINITYSVIGTNGGVCKDTAYLPITVLPLPTIFASVNNTLVCVGQSVSLSATGNAVSYLWTPGNLFGPNQTVAVNAPTTYTLLAQGANGCASFDFVFIDLKNASSLTPIANPSKICAGDSSALSVLGGTVPSWSVNANPNQQFVSPISNTTYTFMAIDANNCSSKVDFNILINEDCDIEVYNGFTPNGDGINDFWVIDNINKIPENKVIVYNRWGKKVFETTNYDNRDNYWDGQFDGKKVPSGTYFFMILEKNNKVLVKAWLEITN